MSMEIWIPYVCASTLILILPGPTILLVISQAVTHGRRSVAPLVAGVLFGDFTAMTLSLLGLGALMAASATLFTLLKWVGTLYLMYLGIMLWRSGSHNGEVENSDNSATVSVLFKRSFIVTALNPKSIAFFVAFLPQFVQPHRPVNGQLVLLGGTFLFLATVNAFVYALFAGQLRLILKKRNVHKWFNRCGGSALIGAAIITAGVKRTA